MLQTGADVKESSEHAGIAFRQLSAAIKTPAARAFMRDVRGLILGTESARSVAVLRTLRDDKAVPSGVRRLAALDLIALAEKADQALFTAPPEPDSVPKVLGVVRHEHSIAGRVIDLSPHRETIEHQPTVPTESEG